MTGCNLDRKGSEGKFESRIQSKVGILCRGGSRITRWGVPTLIGGGANL